MCEHRRIHSLLDDPDVPESTCLDERQRCNVRTFWVAVHLNNAPGPSPARAVTQNLLHALNQGMVLSNCLEFAEPRGRYRVVLGVNFYKTYNSMANMNMEPNIALLFVERN